VKVVPDKDITFSISYNCKALMEKTGGKPYYDTVTVMISENSFGSEPDIQYKFIVVCDGDRLRGFDLNFLVLFFIAIGIIALAIKSPPLLIFKDMTEEE
jgi:hypothetical protein